MIKRNYDSEFCGSLPLHHINQIQPYAYLLVLDPELQIVQLSENLSEVFSEEPRNLVGKNIRQFIKQSEAELVISKFSSGITDKIPFTFTLTPAEGKPKEFTAIIHQKAGCYIVELELRSTKLDFIEVYQEIKFLMAEINAAESVTDISNISVTALKKMAGFDRVLMYQFDEDWNGTVVAEAVEPEMEPYIGLKFPASDIPKQARALYLKNPYRLIPNREDKPVKIYPVVNSVSNSFIDLSDCNLRGVAAVHLEYMQNMGIKASMSIRVIRNGQLWALISCHHRGPKYLTYEICSIFELLSETISSRISAVLYKEDYEFKTELWNKKRSIIDSFYSNPDVFTALVDNDSKFLELFSAAGVAVVYRGKVHLHGITPDLDDVKHLVFWLQFKDLEKVYAEISLPGAYEQASAYADKASGLLAIPIDNRNEDFILLFRPEIKKTVSWGGDPATAINFQPDGKKYHPRNSFAIWQETVTELSAPWHMEELGVAENIRTFIFEYSAKYKFS